MSGAPRSGLAPARFSIAFALAMPLFIVAFETTLGTSYQALLNAAGNSGLLIGLSVVFALLTFVPASFGALVFFRERARPRHSNGRGRLMTVAFGSLLHAASMIAYAAIGTQLVNEDTASGWMQLTLDASPTLATLLFLAVSVHAAGTAVMLGGAFATFGLLSDRTRQRFFWTFDAVLLAALIYVVSVLPSRPPLSSPDALTAPLVRHIVTTLALIRLIVRTLPFLLNGIERLGFLPLVASRHLRSKKSGFLAAITMLSVGAVTVSCVALTTTLSVMGGFRNDLKRKILGNNAHIVLDREHDAIADWRDVLKTTKQAQDVTGAAPYVSGEVMLSSASNLATAVLRGIDPKTIGEVNDLPNNLQAGSLEYLTDPKKLLSLPPSLLQSPLMGLKGGTLEMVEPDAGSPDAGAAQVAARADAGAAPDAGVELSAEGKRLTAQADRIARKLEDIEAFLRQPDRAQNDTPRDVLPGIVVGKELARALRLYVGDEVNVVAPLGTLGPTGPMPKARPFRVAGIFYSGMYEYDMKFTYVALETGQKFLNLGDQISGIEVRVSDLERAPGAAASIRAALGSLAAPNRGNPLRVRDWQELNSRLFGALALEKLAMFIALGIAILVASFCIAGTLTLMVQEKGREVAILKAMGTSDRAVVGVFVIEGGLIGVLGAALGLFLGFMTCFAAEHFGIRMNPEVYYIDRLPVHIDLTEFALTGIAAVLVCLAITVYPALLASRLRPVDALRYE
jgi:lipoprotein-releasing system permease protein